MTGEGEDFLAARNVPYLDGVVRAARGEPAAVGAEGQAYVRIRDGLAREVAEQVPRGGIPNFDQLVIARGGQERAVGTERNANDQVRVADKGESGSAYQGDVRRGQPVRGRQVPDPHGLVLARRS